MRSSSLLSWTALLLPLASSQSTSNTTLPDENGKYWIYGEGITASFIPYGASISNLLIKDQYGIVRDVVGGFDNASYYGIDKQHPHFGGVPGRYANRIKNSTFEIDGVTYHVSPNENPTPEAPEGADTLHGGLDGWDWRNFTVESVSTNSITFSIVDPDGKEGFPGEVISYITYVLGNLSCKSLLGSTWLSEGHFVSEAVSTPLKTTASFSCNNNYKPQLLTSQTFRGLQDGCYCYHEEDAHHAELSHLLEPRRLCQQ